MSRLTTWRGQRNPQLKKAQVFHHLVAKILYICRHTRQDIHTAGEFLYRSKKQDMDNYKKLSCIMPQKI